MRGKLVVGNWKMNGSLGDTARLVQEITAGILGDSGLSGKCDFLICPPFVHIAAARGASSVAAIPAVVGYNRYTHDVDRLAVRYETFIEEFSNILQRQG